MSAPGVPVLSTAKEPTFAITKTGVRCIGETHWAEGKTEEEARRNWKAMATRSSLMDRLMQNLPINPLALCL